MCGCVCVCVQLDGKSLECVPYDAAVLMLRKAQDRMVLKIEKNAIYNLGATLAVSSQFKSPHPLTSTHHHLVPTLLPSSRAHPPTPTHHLLLTLLPPPIIIWCPPSYLHLRLTLPPPPIIYSSPSYPSSASPHPLTSTHHHLLLTLLPSPIITSFSPSYLHPSSPAHPLTSTHHHLLFTLLLPPIST